MNLPAPIAPSQHDIETLARTIWGEARGELREGRIAVACVVMNRFALARARKVRWWGDSIAGICLKVRQFTCWLPDDPNYPKLRAVTEANAIYRDCLKIAAQAAAGELPDNTGGATHYVDEQLLKKLGQKASWRDGMMLTARIGNHTFYKEPEEKTNA